MSSRNNGRKTATRKEIPTPQGMVDSLLLILDKSTDKHDREWARSELVKAMKCAYARWYPEMPEYRINGGDTKVLIEKGSGRIELASHIQIPDLWDIAAWLTDLGGTRDKTMKYCGKALDRDLVAAGKKVLECWHLANALKSHIMGVG